MSNGALSAITGTISQLKSLKDALGAAIEARDAAVFNEKAIELNAQIFAAQELALAAQAAQSALIEQEAALKQEIMELKQWETEKQRYRLNEIASGRFCYTLKESMSEGDPMHHICADCYQNGRKAFLQQEDRMPGRASVLVCHHCGSEIFLTGERRADHSKPAGRRR